MTSLTRRNFLRTTAAGVLGGGLAAAAAPTRPNVLYIMTDQQRSDTLGCYGNDEVETHAIDGLAKRGVRFSSCYATQPVCSPCRSSMMTGLFPNASGVQDNGQPLSDALFSWPRHLHQHGYRTGYIGKWHLGDDPIPEYFDVWRGYETGWSHWIKEEPVYQQPGELRAAYERRLADADSDARRASANVGRYRPDLETDHAIEFIRECNGLPFLCWLSFYPPHTKTAPEEDIARYRGRFENEEQDVYHAMVHRIDANIARLLAEIDALGLTGNTIIVFVSDHGENFPKRWNGHPKRLCYDQSARVPFIVSWPGVLPENKTVQQVFSVADIAPTLLDLCAMNGEWEMHGRSARRLMEGDATGWRHDVLVQNAPYRPTAKPRDGVPVGEMRERAIITDEWKLILNTHRPPELYRRDAERADEVDLFGTAGVDGIVADLLERMRGWGETISDDLALRLVEGTRVG